MRILMIAVAVAATGLAACETVDSQPQQRTASQQRSFDKALAGKVAGKPESCLPLQRSNDMVVIDDDTIIYRDGRTTYVNKPLGGCNNLGNGSYALVTQSQGSQLCRGDIARVRDMTAGIDVGSCALGEFVPYRPAS